MIICDFSVRHREHGVAPRLGNLPWLLLLLGALLYHYAGCR